MSTHYEIQILRSKLIAMTRLTQRTVDYAIKAFQLGRPDLCRAAQTSKEEMRSIRSWIADHGRALLAAGTLVDADSRFVSAALRISSALEAAFTAALNITRHSAIRFSEGWMPVSAELVDAGHFVNRLLRLCIQSLLQRDMRHAGQVLLNGSAGQSFDMAVYLAHHDLAQRTSRHARFELAVVRCLDATAGHAREIADAVLQCHEESEGSEAGDETKHCRSAFADRVAAVPASATDFPGTAPGPLSASSLHPAHRFEQTGDFRISLWNRNQPVRIEDSTQARLMGLQRRVCELLIKNQQLRMALIAGQAESPHDQLC